jgi:hypothetical protein
MISERLKFPRTTDALDRDFSAKSVGIEKPERTDDLDVGGLRHSFLFDEEQLIAANVLGIELIGGFPKCRANSAMTCR